jgi:hypothetical protein
MMSRAEYMEMLLDAFDSGKISAEAYDVGIQNADIFCDDDDEDDYDCWIPDTYAEIEYYDFDDPEAIDGSRWDDMNYLRYMER